MLDLSRRYSAVKLFIGIVRDAGRRCYGFLLFLSIRLCLASARHEGWR
jgi:hypothetical protein